MKVTIELSEEEFQALERHVQMAVNFHKTGTRLMVRVDKLLARIYLEAKKARRE